MTQENTKWLVVVNPKASVGKAGEDWPLINKDLENESIDFDSVVTERPKHAIEIVRKAIIEQGYRKFISVGGDGTNNEIINGIFTQDVVPSNEITFGAVPVGTGNDWSRTFGFPLDYKAIAKIIKANHVFVHDIGQVTYNNSGDPKIRYFLNAAGTGLDYLVCESTNELKQKGKKGTIRYLLSVVTSLLKYKGDHVQITIEDQMVFDDRILSLSIGNCRFNGGGMMMMRDAIPNDGLLDITAIRKVSLLKFALNVKNIYDGTFIDKLKEVSTFRGKKVHVVSIPPNKLNVETEGETLTNSPFDFKILPLALKVVVPENPKF